MQTLVLSWLVSFVILMLLLRFRKWHTHLSSDSIDGVQKFHCGSVPRIGGVGVLMGLIAALGWGVIRELIHIEVAWLLLAIAPVFAAGLIEDLTKHVSATTRMLAIIASAAIAAWSLDAILPRLGIPVLDTLLAQWPLLAWGMTLVAVAGVTNAFNIIDGFNGLAAATAMLILIAFGYVAWNLGDTLIIQICLAMIGALAGFFVWNYPRGFIFLGDGGSYLIGFVLAEVAVLMTARHAELSPWFFFLACIYPITETLFSIYRKALLRRMSPALPDGLHLHMLIYRRLVRWAAGHEASRDLTARNSATSPYLWALASIGIIPAVLFWRDERLLIVSTSFFVAGYVWLYWRLIRFRAPRWLTRKVR